MNTNVTVEEVKKVFDERGIRHSKKRETILEIFLNTEGHLTIEEVWTAVRKVDPKIGYVTVYRALKLLKEMGLAHQLQLADGQSRFERPSAHHDHLICLKCGQILEFENDKIEQLQDQVAQENAFQIISHVHEIYGYCLRCQQQDPALATPP